MDQNQRFGGFNRMSMLPPVIKGIIIINVIVFISQFLFLDNYTIGKVPLESFLALQPFEGGIQGHFYIWQLITYQFLHGGLMHIFFNLFALWMFGVELETSWGSRKFLVYYLLCGVGAGIAQLMVPYFISDYPLVATIGASGAIYGVLLAFGLTFPNRPIFMFPIFIPIPAKIFVILFAGFQFFMGFTSSDGVAHFAHLGGAATGFILFKFGDALGVYKLGNLFSKSRKHENTYYSSDTYQQNPNIYNINWQNPSYSAQPSKKSSNINGFYVAGEEITQKKIDEILDKISASGYQNLSEKEKEILFELSQKLK